MIGKTRGVFFLNSCVPFNLTYRVWYDLACVQSLPAANSRYVVINGLCWSMTTKSTIPKSHGMVSSGVGFLFGSVALVFYDLSTLFFEQTGVQTHFYFTQFRWEGGEGNEVRKRSDTWHDSHHYSFPGVCNNTGTLATIRYIAVSLITW